MADFDEMHPEVTLFTITPRKLRKWDLLAVVVQTAGHMVGAVSDALTDATGLLLRHSEYEQTRHEFYEDAAVELESLFSEVEGMD